MSATYRFWSLRDGTLTLVGGGIKTNPLGQWGMLGPGNFLPQQDGRGIDVGDLRASDAVFRNGHVYYSQAINMPPGGTGYGLRTAVQWVELDTAGRLRPGRTRSRTPVPARGTEGTRTRFPSIAVNAQNDVLLGFSEFQSTDYADAAYAFRAATDPPGTMREPVTLKDGEGPYKQDARRPQPGGRLQRVVRRPVGRFVSVDGAGVSADSNGSSPPRRVRALGCVVGTHRRRPAADAAPVRRAEAGREAARQGLAPGRRGALSPWETAPREV